MYLCVRKLNSYVQYDQVFSYYDKSYIVFVASVKMLFKYLSTKLYMFIESLLIVFVQ